MLSSLLVLANCGGPPGQSIRTSGIRSDTPTVEVDSPIYFPSALPPDVGKESITVDSDRNGYTLVERVGQATYRLSVTAVEKGRVALPSTSLAVGRSDHRADPNGNMQWSDEIADVAISVEGSPRPTGSAASIIASGLVVVPRSVLDEYLADPAELKVVDLDPLEFVRSNIAIPQALSGRVGHAKVRIAQGRDTNLLPICFACESPRWITGWKAGSWTHTLVALPAASSVGEVGDVTSESVFDPMLGSRMMLLSTQASGPISVPVTTTDSSGTRQVNFGIRETTP